MYVFVGAHLCIYIYIHVKTYLCVYIYIYVCVSVHMHAMDIETDEIYVEYKTLNHR